MYQKLMQVIFILLLISFAEPRGLTREQKDEVDNQHMHPDVDTANLKIKNEDELKSEFWRDNAQNYLRMKIDQIKEINTKKAKNLIIFLGDGMSVHTVTAARMYMGGEEMKMSFDQFPYVGLSKTYCVNRQVADSACSATAYLSGVKGNYGTIGVNAQVERYDCDKALLKSMQTESIVGWGQKAKKSTGLVTTTRVTHATPAGVYAHIADRDWETDQDVYDGKCDPSKTPDIARQLIESDIGRNLNVIMGGGRRSFIDKSALDDEGMPGRRMDGRNLIEEWKTNQNKLGNAQYVWNKQLLNEVNIAKTDYLMGLFASSHNLFNVEVQNQSVDALKPSLWDMVQVAIKMLQKNENGYVLFVEGGLIDLAHHENWAKKALDETVEFHYTIANTKEMTKDTDTLIIVTADHAHTMTYNGYPSRGNPIIGPSNKDSGDKLQFTAISYANGRGYFNTYHENGSRTDVTKLDYSDLDLRFMAGVPIASETHGGDDVAIYADGPFAHIFTGNYEQNNIPLLMAYATEIGPYKSSGVSFTSTWFQTGFLIVLLFNMILTLS